MRTIVYLILAMVLICCKTKTKKEEPKVNSKSVAETPNFFKNAEKSEVLVTLKGKDYRSPVNCSYFGEDYFYFKSDKLETTDTNGDGIVITGHQRDQKMILTVIVDGKTYSAANLGVQKREFTAIGKGKLFMEDTAESFEASYKVMCK